MMDKESLTDTSPGPTFLGPVCQILPRRKPKQSAFSAAGFKTFEKYISIFKAAFET
jgi:hypothetical protein